MEATDGSIGKIDEATYDGESAHVVVDTGFWIFGHKRLIHAGAVMGVDQEARKVGQPHQGSDQVGSGDLSTFGIAHLVLLVLVIADGVPTSPTFQARPRTGRCSTLGRLVGRVGSAISRGRSRRRAAPPSVTHAGPQR